MPEIEWITNPCSFRLEEMSTISELIFRSVARISRIECSFVSQIASRILFSDQIASRILLSGQFLQIAISYISKALSEFASTVVHSQNLRIALRSKICLSPDSFASANS